MTMKLYIKDKQKGAVSLFIVIFTALLITIVTVSFIQIMLRGQQEATTVDLSQSAYDSAIAGVEDAKQALVLATNGNAAAQNALLTPDKCNTVKRALDSSVPASDDSETIIRQNDTDENSLALSQAYTCVKVNPVTSSVEGELLNNKPTTMVPLLSGGLPFNKIKISWSLHRDSSITDGVITFPPKKDATRPTALPQPGQWGIKTPALMRAQLVQYDTKFLSSALDSNPDPVAGGPSGITRTKFLYPMAAGLATASFKAGTDATPTPVKCTSGVAVVYNCQVTIDLLAMNGPGYQAYLQLADLYNQADYKIELYNDSILVNFDNVQATVDSTGRAGDVFRRVNARIDLLLNNSFSYPQAAIDLDGSLCKTFRITDAAADYDTAGSTCKPWA